MATAGELVVLIAAKDEASKALDGIGQKLGGLGKLAGVALAGVAAAGVGFTAGIVGAVGAAMDFESAMSAVGAVAGASGSELAALSQTALQLGQDTTLAGVSASDAAKAMAELASGGISVADIMGGAARGALLLASAGGLDVAQAAEIAAAALNNFGLAGSQTGHIADLFAAAANSSAVTVTDLGESMKYIGPIANSMGLSIEEVTAALAELGDQGIKGGQAGTSLRSILSSLAKPSKQAATLINELGLEFFDAGGKMKSLAGISEQLKTHLSGLTDQQRANALVTLFGNEALSAATVLYGEGADGIAKYLGQVNVAGSAAANGAARNDNLRGSIEQLKSSWETASITLGTAFIPLVRQVVDVLSGAVNAAIPLIKVLGPQFVAALQSGIGQGVAIVQAFGAAVLAMVNSLRTGDFSNLFGPLIVAISTAFGSETAGKVTLFVSNLVTGLNLARDAVLTAKQAFAGDWVSADSIATPVRIIGELFLTLGQAVRTVQGLIAQIPAPVLAAAAAFLALGPALSIVGAILPTIIGALTGLGPIISILTSTLPLLGSVIAALGGPLTLALVAVGALAAAWATDFMGIQTATMPVIDAIGTAITGQLLPALNQVGPYLSTVVVPAFVQGWAAMQGATDNAVSAMQPAIERFTGFLSGQLIPAIQGIAAVAGPAFDQMRAAAVGAFEAARPGLEAFVAGVQQLASVVAPIMAQVGAAILDSLGPAIAAMTDWAQTVIPQFAAAFENVLSIVGPIVGELASLIGAGLSAIAGFVEAHSAEITSVLTNAWNIISSTIGAVFAVITGLISAGLQVISGDWSGAWTTIQATTASVWASIQSVISSAIAIVSTIVSTAAAEWQSLIAAAWAAIQAAAAAAMAGLVAAIQSGMASAASAIASGVAGFPAAVLAIGGAMFSAGASIIGQLAAGIESAIGQAIAKVQEGLQQIANLLPHSEPKDPSSPLRGLGDAGEAIFGMLADGIGRGAPEAIRATQDAAGAIARSLADTLGRLGTLTDTPSDKSAAGIMRLFAANFAVALDTMKATASAAGDFLAEAQAYKSLILLAVTAIREAQAALNTVNFGGGGLAIPEIKRGGENVGNSLTEGIKRSLDIHSPSQVMAAIGKDVIDGLVQGMSDAQQDAAKQAADVASAVAKAIQDTLSAATALGKLDVATLPTGGQITGILGFARALVAEMAAASTMLNEDGAKATTMFADAASKVASAISAALGALGGLASYVPPVAANIYAFGKTLRLAVNDLTVLAAEIPIELAASAATFAEQSAKAIAVYGTGADAFGKLRDYARIGAASIYAFGKDLRLAVQDLAALVDIIGQELADKAGAFGEQIGKATGGIAGAVAGFVALRDYVRVPAAALYGFGKDLLLLVQDFAAIVDVIGVEMLTKAGQLGEAVGKITGSIAGAVAGFAALKDYVSPAYAAMQAFVADTRALVTLVIAAAQGFATDGLKAASDFADTAGKALGLLASGVAGFLALDKLVAPSQASMDLFARSAVALVVAIQRASAGLAGDGLKAAGEFADTAGKVLGIVANGVTGLKDLITFVAPAQSAMDAFATAVRDMMATLARLAGTVATEGASAAATFAEAVGKVFAGLNAGTSFFKSLDNILLPDQGGIDRILAPILATVGAVANAARAFDPATLGAATAFADAFGSITGNIQAGNNALLGAGGGGGGAGGTTQIIFNGPIYGTAEFDQRIQQALVALDRTGAR